MFLYVCIYICIYIHIYIYIYIYMYITSGMTIRSVNYSNSSRPIHPCRQLADGHQGSSEGALGIALDILGLNTSGIHGKTIGKSLGKP